MKWMDIMGESKLNKLLQVLAQAKIDWVCRNSDLAITEITSSKPFFVYINNYCVIILTSIILIPAFSVESCIPNNSWYLPHLPIMKSIRVQSTYLDY